MRYAALATNIYNQTILDMIAERNEIEDMTHTPLVGDFIRLKDGKHLRVTEVQEFDKKFIANEVGNFFLNEKGKVSFQGYCGDDAYKFSKFRFSNEYRSGSFKFWCPDEKGILSILDGKAEFRVFVEV